MLIKILDPVTQTIFFAVIFFGLLIASMKKSEDQSFFSKEVTNQLKGLAILAVLFSHIGYFLSSDIRFLYPFSVLGGVGVNIFLFLSGFGLTVSQLNSPLSPLSYYKKRLPRLYIPLWIVITVFIILDNIFLHRIYPVSEIINSYLGFFPRADLFSNIDSPLWYFTIILFYYLIFPLVFIKKIPLLSPFIILVISSFILNLNLPVNEDTLKLYKLHTLAFPLGITFGILYKKIKLNLNNLLKYIILLTATIIFLYSAIHSGVGEGLKIEQGISLITTISAVIIFSFLKFNFKLLSIFGILSYEIYLIHCPILSRFDLFLSFPPLLFVIFNIIFISLLALILQKLVGKILNLVAQD